ncbi:MarR family winged helix-turn-helix transcriptional regulator [Falsiruegeria litorea]|nr:MarR family winged helix-turn-helix transcriptional regulator [Falsiruegeria litorea]
MSDSTDLQLTEGGASGARVPLSDLRPEDFPKGMSVLAVSVFRLSRLLKAQVTRVVSQDKDINLVSWRILVGLRATSSATQRELVDFTKAEQAQLSRVLRQMEERGLIEAKPDPNDRRARVFTMTAKGKEKFQALLPFVADFADAVDTALDDVEKRQFFEMCEKIAHASRVAGKVRQ